MEKGCTDKRSFPMNKKLQREEFIGLSKIGTSISE